MPTEFGRRILEAAQHAGLTQTSLETALLERGQLTTRGYLSRVVSGERGVQSIDPHFVEAIADICDVDFHWLSTGRGKMWPPLSPASSRSGVRDKEKIR